MSLMTREEMIVATGAFPQYDNAKLYALYTQQLARRKQLWRYAIVTVLALFVVVGVIELLPMSRQMVETTPLIVTMVFCALGAVVSLGFVVIVHVSQEQKYLAELRRRSAI